MRLSDLWSKPIPPPPPPPPEPEMTVDELHEFAVREEAEREVDKLIASQREEQAARWNEEQRLAEQRYRAEQAERARRAHERAVAQKVERVRLGLPPVEPLPEPPPPPVQVEAFIRPPDYGYSASGHRLPMGTGYAYRPPHF